MRKPISILLLIFIVGSCSLVAWSQSRDKPAAANQSPSAATHGLAGNWEGTLSAGGQKLRLVLKISQSADGALRATVDSLDQGAMDLTIDTITKKDGGLHFEMKDLFAAYDATFSSDGSEMTGTWSQAGNSFPLIFRKAGSVSGGNGPSSNVPPSPEKPGSALKAATATQSIAGNWEGVLTAGQKLRLLLKISQSADGALKATMDSLDQSASDLTVDTITSKDGVLHFEMKDLPASYEGAFSSDGSEVVGKWTQGGSSLPLIFRKAGSVQSSAGVERGKVQLKPCNKQGITKDALCGKYEVFEVRSAKSGRKIALNIVLLPALSAKPAADALFYLVGGPGGAATASAAATFMPRLRRERDVVLVDQRGTGESNPLGCDLFGVKPDMRAYFAEFPLDKLRLCREQLEKVANLKLYTTSIAMDDLDEVRAAFGYDRIDVYGGSYGSTAALVYLRQHPERVRTATIFGVAPPNAKIPLSFAKGVQHAMDRLFEDCAGDSACNAAYPKLREEFEIVLKRFDKGPVEVTAVNKFTRESQQVSVTRDAFVDSVRVLLYVPQAMSLMPLLIHTAAQGDLAPLVDVGFQVVYQLTGQLYRGMQFSVVCAEDDPFISEEEIKHASEGTFYGDTRVRLTRKACAEWPRAPVPASFLEPVKSTAPVLIISGELDPVTPPWLAEDAARSLPNSRRLVVHNATHTSYECVENVVANFIDQGSSQGLDVSCIDQIRRLPFTIPAKP